MSEHNKTIVCRWFEEVWNQKRVEAIDELFASDGTVHGLGPQSQSRSEFKTFHASYCNAFPDLNIRMDDLIAEGDKVAYRWTATATHGGDGLGFAATGRRMIVAGMGIVRVVNGQVVEGWNSFDQVGMMRQLGVMAQAI